MKTLFRFIILILLVGGWTLAAASLYVIRTGSPTAPLILLPRDRVATNLDELKETYVDIRDWTLEDVPAHREVVKRMLQTGKAAALSHLVKPGNAMSLEAQLADAVQREPSTVPATTRATQPATSQTSRTNQRVVSEGRLVKTNPGRSGRGRG